MEDEDIRKALLAVNGEAQGNSEYLRSTVVMTLVSSLHEVTGTESEVNRQSAATPKRSHGRQGWWNESEVRKSNTTNEDSSKRKRLHDTNATSHATPTLLAVELVAHFLIQLVLPS